MPFIYDTTPRHASRHADPPEPAREAVVDAFGRHARALDQGSFVDHPPVRRQSPAVDSATWAALVARALKLQLTLE